LFAMTVMSSRAPAAIPSEKPTDEAAQVAALMAELRKANKSRRWNETLYDQKDWKVRGHTAQGRPLIYFSCGENTKNTTLLLSSVHGDEITPIYFGLRLVMWIKGEPDLCRDHRIIVAPLVNPDGYLAKRPTRVNGRGVDLNRNFPTKDFDQLALAYWKKDRRSDPRHFPGDKGGSEPETQFQQWLIDEFRPAKILTVHSPLNFFDYDGPDSETAHQFAAEYLRSCEELRREVKSSNPKYNFLRYGFYPGSLGNYAGRERGIPTLTLELPTVDAAQAKVYFELFKKGTRRLIVYQLLSRDTIATQTH
jgi:murein peptide amidase A